MPNIYDIYLQFKAIGAVEYKKELFIFSKETDKVFYQKSTEEEYQTYCILPYYRITSIIKNDIAEKNKSLFHKIKIGKILFDNINFIAKLRDYINFLLQQKSVNVDFLFVRKHLSVIDDNIQKYDSLQNPKLKEIYLSVIKQKVIDLYDTLYFDKEKIILQIENSDCEVEQTQFLAINKLLNLTHRTDTQKLEKTVASLITQSPVLSYYQSINNSKDFEPSKQLFIILKTSYLYEDIIFDLKTPFERTTKSKLYAKYDKAGQIIFEIITNNKNEREKLYDRLAAVLQKYLEKSKSTFKIQTTDSYPDIWAFELNNSKIKLSLNNDLHNLMLALKNQWTQDYALSVALIVISKILQTLYKNESECAEQIDKLYRNWLVFLIEDNSTTNVFQFSKNKEFRTASLIKQVEAMSNDIALLANFFEHEETNKYILKTQKNVVKVISKQPENSIEKDSAVLGLMEEICSSLGVLKKNLPYIASLLKTHKEALWKII